MNQITVRGISHEVEKAIREESQRKSLSLNKAIVSLLKKGAGLQEQKEKRCVYHDLDSLFGRWSQQEADEFARNIKDQEQIDEEVWK